MLTTVHGLTHEPQATVKEFFAFGPKNNLKNLAWVNSVRDLTEASEEGIALRRAPHIADVHLTNAKVKKITSQRPAVDRRILFSRESREIFYGLNSLN